MTKLSVNVNKIATLRNARGKNTPNLLKVTQDIINYGAEGITVHPRPDERHIKKADAIEISKLIKKVKSDSKKHIEYNIEGYPSSDFIQLISDLKPDQCTLVPDPPDAITSCAGWNFEKNKGLLLEVVSHLQERRIRCSLFLEPKVFNSDKKQQEALEQIRPHRIELYTELYADDFSTFQRRITTMLYSQSVQVVQKMNIGINAGHDLNLENLGYLLQTIPKIEEVSIGHALICESLYCGLKETIQNYLNVIKNAFNS